MDQQAVIDRDQPSEDRGPLPSIEYDLFAGEAEERRSVKPNFSLIVYDESEAEKQPRPNVGPLLERLARRRLLIIAGGYPDKRGLARQCGWEMAEFISDTGDPDQRAPSAFELRASNQAEDLFLFLDEEKDPTVFVFPGMHPSKINQNLWALTDSSRSRHWVVISTDQTREAWRLGEELDAVWVEPQEHELYNPGDLKSLLTSLLGKEGERRLVSAAAPDDAEAVRDSLASDLGSPQSIRSFVTALNRLEPQSTIDLQTLVRDARSNRLAIQSWFGHLLTPRDQVIAIALSLFDGMEEDIVFTAIERLMEGSWRKRDTSIRFIDYADLADLTRYFALERGGNSPARVRTLGDQTRAAILESAWRTHRRLIIAALPELVSLVTKGGQFDLQVVDRHTRLAYLRETIGRSLGEIALLSIDAVEPHLLLLVISGAPRAHQAVTSALRQIRSRGSGEQLFDMLRRWRTHSDLRRYIERIVEDKDALPVAQRIGAAVAASLGQLALEDPPNAIHEEIVRLARAYASSDDAVIVRHLAAKSLPFVLSTHTTQAIGLMPDLLQRVGTEPELSAHMVAGCGLGLGYALRAGKLEAIEAVHQWVDQGLAVAHKGFDKDEVRLREKTLGAAACALGYARPLSRPDLGPAVSRSMRPSDAIALLNRILAEERHPFVREKAIAAIFDRKRLAEALSELA